MRTVIVIPWRGDDGGWRDRNFEVVLPRVEALGYQVYVSDSGDEPFSIARTWNLLAEMAEPWDRLIRWGADFVIEDHESVHRAVETVSHRCLLFDQVTHLTQAETEALHEDPWSFPSRNQTLEEGKAPWGGPNVTTREAWDAVGGFDSEFLGYGYEDVVHVRSLERLYGASQTVPGRMANLWHPREGGEYWERRESNRALMESKGFRW